MHQQDDSASPPPDPSTTRETALTKRLRAANLLNLGLSVALISWTTYQVFIASAVSTTLVSPDGGTHADVALDDERATLDIELARDGSSSSPMSSRASVNASAGEASLHLDMSRSAENLIFNSNQASANVTVNTRGARMELSTAGVANGVQVATNALVMVSSDGANIKLCHAEDRCAEILVNAERSSLVLARDDSSEMISLRQQGPNGSVTIASQQGEITLTVDPDSPDGALIRVKQPSGRAMELRPGAIVFINDDGTERGRVDHTSCVAEAAPEAQP